VKSPHPQQGPRHDSIKNSRQNQASRWFNVPSFKRLCLGNVDKVERVVLNALRVAASAAWMRLAANGHRLEDKTIHLSSALGIWRRSFKPPKFPVYESRFERFN
jgi:hypothetical protein